MKTLFINNELANPYHNYTTAECNHNNEYNTTTIVALKEYCQIKETRSETRRITDPLMNRQIRMFRQAKKRRKKPFDLVKGLKHKARRRNATIEYVKKLMLEFPLNLK